MSRPDRRRYGERDSSFFRLRSKKKLASLLHIREQHLCRLTGGDSLYRDFEKQKHSGGIRKISAPREDLKFIQRRIANLLGRIETPDFLYAPVSGRSYVDNAAVHRKSDSFHFLDIEDFFPNCTSTKVIWFFLRRMECSEDVAVILRKLVTHNECLPQGSPCSPILSYWSYVDMWDEISTTVRNADCRLSVYIDDVTISGKIIRGEMIWKIKKILRKHGHGYKLEKEKSTYKRPVEVTGVILRPDGRLTPPNRSHKKLYDHRGEAMRSRSNEHKAELALKIRGREAQMRQIEAGNSR